MTNREHFFGDTHIVDTIMLLTWDGDHTRKECTLFKKELKDMVFRGNQLKDWLNSEKDPRFNW